MTNGHVPSASMKDVASYAEVSVGTVSNVLNRPEVVAAATRLRVERAMAELHFVRNGTARQLRIGSSSTLAFVMLDAANPFFSDVARGIEETAESASLSLISCNSSQRLDRQERHLSMLEQQRVRGLLVTPIDAADPHLDQIALRGTPVVVIDRSRDDLSLCSVAGDNKRGGRLAVEHLISCGHRRICFVGGPVKLGQVADRYDGAAEAWRDAGRAISDLVWHGTAGLGVTQGRLAGDRILAAPQASRPTAVFAANDLVALGLLQAATAAGVTVPTDLAIIGYDDIEFAAAAAVPLTSIGQPRFELGKTAARLVLDEVQNKNHRHERRTFEPALVVRSST